MFAMTGGPPPTRQGATGYPPATRPSHRLELASCSAEAGAFVIHYYSFLALENDLEMRDCLGRARGSWTAIPRTSIEYQRAKGEYEIEKLHGQHAR